MSFGMKNNKQKKTSVYKMHQIKSCFKLFHHFFFNLFHLQVRAGNIKTHQYFNISLHPTYRKSPKICYELYIFFNFNLQHKTKLFCLND